MWRTVFVGVGCSRLLLVAPMIPHLECAHLSLKFGLSLCEAEGPRGGASERRQRRMRSTLVMRQEALATGVSATGTEVEGGESTWGYFRLFFLYIGGRRIPGRASNCRKEVRDPSHPPDRDWGAGCGTPGLWRLLVSVRVCGGAQDQADVRDRDSGPVECGGPCSLPLVAVGSCRLPR